MEDKCSLMGSNLTVRAFLQKNRKLSDQMELLPDTDKYLLMVLIYLQQTDLLADKEEISSLQRLLSTLRKLEEFYEEIGGIIGYHTLLLSLASSDREALNKSLLFHNPPLIDISDYAENLAPYLHEGIASLPYMAEFYPLGGAADRLHLQEEKTGKELPAAKLEVGNKSLLERLLDDLIAREYLYFKLYQKQVRVPVIIMTSHAKDNHRHILSLLEEKSWFFRDKDSFHIMIQPQVPTITEEGKWAIGRDGLPLRKPSGHGVLWKLAQKHQIFTLLRDRKVSKAIVRQINNPLAGLDYNLLLLSGYGYLKDQYFGFFCTKRKKGAQEGAVVLTEDNDRFSLTNIEYCDFIKRKIDPTHFPSNTNILFVDIEKIEKAVKENPFPGLLVNWKKSVVYDKGKQVEKKIARLESTMQNIADQFVEEECSVQKGMRQSFAIYNEREKLISTAKKVYQEENDGSESPERCFYDLQYASWDLLQNYCQIDLTEWPSWEKYKEKGAPILFSYHPALGPLYAIIAQKMQGGSLADHSECHLDIAELYWSDVHIEGFFSLEAINIYGHVESEKLCYSNETGKCYLKNVTVKNGERNNKNFREVWREKRKDKGLSITIHGNGEFYAENLIIEGNHHFEVKDKHSLHLSQKDGKLIVEEKKLYKPTWFWGYKESKKGSIILSRHS